MPAVKSRDVIEIEQRVSSNNAAIGIEQSIVPAALFPKLETQLQFGQHLYPVFADYGLIVTRIEETIGIEPATDAIAELLGCDAGVALLVVSRIATAIDGQAIEWRIGRYVPDRVRYASVA